MKPESNVEPLDWRIAFGLVEVKADPISCFKIIPDKSITNYSNYKFFKDMSELEGINNIRENAKNVGNALTGKGLKFVYQLQNNYIWYEVVIRGGEINFYVLCSKPNENFVKVKLEQTFPNAPIELVDEAETMMPEENTSIADLKLQRHNFFSLRTNYQEQTQPIEDILACAEDVQEGDILKFSLRAQPYDRNYWSYKAEEWEAQVKKGKTPKRMRINKQGMINGVFGLSDIAFHKLGELFREIHHIAFRKEEKRQIIISRSDFDAREIGEITKQTNYKMTAPVFRADMKVASHSESESRRVLNMKSLTNAFVDVKDSNNGLVRTTIYEKPENALQETKTGLLNKIFKREKKPKKESSGLKEHAWKSIFKEVNNHRVSPFSAFDIDFNILCDKELGKLSMLPTSKLQKRLNDKMDALTNTEAPIPEEFQNEVGVSIGTAELKGESYPITIPVNNPDEFYKPIVSSGIMGAGKDTFGTNYVYECAMQGNGAVVLDVIDEDDRGMTDSLLKVLPPDRVVVLDFSDEEYVPYLDWAEAVTEDTNNRFNKSKFASELTKFFAAEEEAGIQTERYLREVVKAMRGESVLKMGLLMTSQTLREETIKRLRDQGDLACASFWEAYGNEGEGRQKQIAAPILNRLHKLSGDDALKYLFAQKPTGKIDFDKWLGEGKVILCKMPKDLYTSNGIKTLVHWLTVKVWLTKQRQFREKRMTGTILVLNELHQQMTPGLQLSLEEIFPESRKFKLGVVTLFHDLKQIPKDLFDIMESSGANFVILKQDGMKAWKRFEHRIKESYDLDECMSIVNHEAVIGFKINGKERVIRVKMNHTPENRGAKVYDNKYLVKEHAKAYFQKITDVEAEIQETELLLVNGFKKDKKKK